VSETSDTLRADLDKQPEEVASMFDHVASRYDLMNALMSGGMDRLWSAAMRTAVGAVPGETILDLAAGTGASSASLARSGARVVACDLSEGMIEVGRRRHPGIEFVQGDATDLGFPDDSFDAVTISYGLRNVVDTRAALREMARVTRPGGRLVVCEFSTPPNPAFRRLYRFYLGAVIGTLARVASSDEVAYDYLVESILAWHPQEDLGRLIARSGWERVEYKDLTGGIVALHRAYKPRS
jgi:demethylmenaquinone methyltransferase/2-methoxy-6-polyprenyl-1,4-benzoquinol methylase